MLDHTAATLTLRNRALGLTVCTTGSQTLSATVTGYARTTGSFVTDGFLPGMEIVPAGFVSNPVAVVQQVTALAITTVAGRTAEAAAPGCSLTVGLPQLRAFENIDFVPVGGRPYLEEDYVPATTSLLTTDKSSGVLEETGLYHLKWYGLSNFGLSIRKCVDALKALFAPGTSFTLASGILRVRTDTSVYAGQILPQPGGWSVITLTIPWRAYTQNAISP